MKRIYDIAVAWDTYQYLYVWMSNIICDILNPKEERIYNIMIRERFAIIICTCIRLSHVLGMVNGRFVDKTTTAYRRRALLLGR